MLNVSRGFAVSARPRATPSNRRCCARMSEAEVRRRIEKARNVVRCREQLVPYDYQTFNAASLVWTCIADIPEERRVDLLDLLNIHDIRDLWSIAAERYSPSREMLAEIDLHSPLDDLPEKPGEVGGQITPISSSVGDATLCGQVVRFEGKAATMWGLVGLNRFSKILFVDPETCDVHGRMLPRRVPFSNALYPLYFRVAPRQMRIPATGEASELAMEYLDAWEGRHLQREGLPDAKWPLPSDPPFPFHGGVTEYLRPVGPGCYVGVGWREPRLEFGDIGRKFLTFAIVKTPNAS